VVERGPCVAALIKPQYVDHIPKAVKGAVGECLEKRDERGKTEELIELLDLVRRCRLTL
jgi:ATP-binding cassette subfamily E protein 1